MDIGLIGYGGVGKAFIKLLVDKRDFLKEKGIVIKVKYIIKSNGGIYIKEGIDLEEGIALEDDITKHKYFNKDININTIIGNKDIDTLVELTNTDLETGGVGLNHIILALENKINVVTGNKGPIVLDYNNLKDIADKNNVKLLFGCTTGGALPTLNAGTYDIAGSEITKIEGILNGTSNYILTEMYENNDDYEVVLKKAIKEKIAEKNYSYDVEGYDTAAKVLIVANALMEANLKLKDIKIDGITKVTKEEILIEKQKGNKPKLIGNIYKEENKIK
ncbi:homoserine dehydrogenase, partial [Clostridium sp.]|uniref:homoserine dehydrogenase n=1 Tax=Clostridium sp. TaxID=1506 RepID=UPI00260AA925